MTPPRSVAELRAEVAKAALNAASEGESKKQAHREFEALRLEAVRADRRKRRKEKKNGRN